MLSRHFTTAALVLTLAAPAAFAQSNPGFFIPPSAQQPAVPAQPAPHVQATAPAAPAPAPQPAIPDLPPLPKGAPPPVASIGVLSVPDVMQNSTAAQGVQKIIQAREADLGAQAQAARQKINAEQQQIAAQRSVLTEQQFDAKVQALRDEVAATQTQFQLKNQAIQNSGQAAVGKIEAELIAIIRQEAQARGMNLVLHREQVALNVNAFDITADCTVQLNKDLPSVTVPPSVVTPGMTVNPPPQDGAGDGQDGQ